MSRILYLTWVKTYYRQNAIFVFVIILVAFGFLRAKEHLTLIHYALEDYGVFFLACLLWILHGIKVIAYARRALLLKENEFLQHLLLFTRTERLWSFFGVIFQLVQLTFLYSLAMLIISYSAGYLEKGLLGIAVHFLLCAVGALVLESQLNRPKSLNNSRAWRAQLPIPQVLYYPYYLVSRQTVLFLVSKVFSGTVLMMVCLLYPTDDYDIRLLGLGGLMGAYSQSVIFQYWYFFERAYFDYYKNLPLSLFRRYYRYFVTVFILLIPEIIVLLRNWPVEYTSFPQILILMVGIAMGLLFYQMFKGEFQGIFFSGVGLSIAIMFDMPMWLYGLGAAGIGYLLLSKYYYLDE
jgi:hypothetical protein